MLDASAAARCMLADIGARHGALFVDGNSGRGHIAADRLDRILDRMQRVDDFA
jgi:hypothetical protein